MYSGRHGRMKRFIIGLVLGLIFMGLLWYFVHAGQAPEVVQLPQEIIEKLVQVEVVKEIPGPPTVVERIKWRTREVPVDRPVIQEVVRVVEKAAELGTLFADVEIEADKHVGMVEDRIVAGWVGTAACRVKAEEGDPWLEIANEPFHVEHSQVLSEIKPKDLLPRVLPRVLELATGLTSSPGARLEARWFGQGKRLGFWVSGDWVPDPDSVTAFLDPQQYDYQTTTFEADSYVVAGGVAYRFGKK